GFFFASRRRHTRFKCDWSSDVCSSDLPPGLEVSARTAEGEIMGVRHRALVVEGVQFHPESILTPEGPRLLANFLKETAGERGEQIGRASCRERGERSAVGGGGEQRGGR